MALPTNRQELRDFVLRKLGEPLNQVNVSEDQINDRIDEALLYYSTFHYGGVEEVLIPIELTQEDIDQRRIPIPDGILTISAIYGFGADAKGSGIREYGYFTPQYQMMQNTLFSMGTYSAIPYYLANRHLELLEWLISNAPTVKFNTNNKWATVDAPWDNVREGHRVTIRANRTVDPENSRVWSDLWFLEYVYAIVKKQYAWNLKKYNIQMIGGVTYNGQQMYDEALVEIANLKEEMKNSFSEPPLDFIG